MRLTGCWYVKEKHTHMYSQTSEEERGGGAEEGGYTCGLFHVSEGEWRRVLLLTLPIFLSPSFLLPHLLLASPFHILFSPPPSSFLHLSHFLVFPSSNPLLSIRLLPSSLSIVVSSSSHLPQPYFLHPIALSFSNPSFFPAVIRSVRTAAMGWAPNKN